MVHVCWLHRVRIIVFYVCFFFYFAIGKRQRWHGCGLARPLHSMTERAHSSGERSRARRTGGTCARFGHSWIPARAAWRKCPSEHAPLPSPHETPASLSCFIQCCRRGCYLQIYSVVDGTASVVLALRLHPDETCCYGYQHKNQCVNLGNNTIKLTAKTDPRI